MKKKYEIPELEVINLESSDLICTSCTGVGCTPTTECEGVDFCATDMSGCSFDCDADTK